MREHGSVFGWVCKTISQKAGKRLKFAGVVLLAVVFFAEGGAIAAISAHGGAEKLSTTEARALRFKLENLWSEMDLAVRNQKVDRSDVKHQERDFQMLRVYDRIPIEEKITELEQELSTAAKLKGLRVSKVEVLSRSLQGSQIPEKVYSDSASFRLTQDQLVEKIQIRIEVFGPRKEAQKWAMNWKNELIRYLEIDRVQSRGARVTSFEATAYRFRNIQYPRVVPRDPVELLPNWARKNPEVFSKKEPELWTLVTRIQKLTPRAAPLYESRRVFLMNDARISFFLAKETEGE